MPGEAQRAAGLCVFRNAVDIVGLVVLHHLHTLVEHVYAIDNGSTDGSFELIGWLAARTGRITLIRDPEIRPKRHRMTELARQALREGFALVVPFDSDELWDGSRSSLEAAFSTGANAARCRVLNFIQRRNVTRPRHFSWRHARRRCEVLGDVTAAVQTGDASFMESTFPAKVAFLAHESVAVRSGQHAIDRDDLRQEDAPALTVLHLPMRARTELQKRSHDYEPRRAALRTAHGDAWQSQYWKLRLDAGFLEQEWEALSYGEDGDLLVRGVRRVPTFIDGRAARHLYRAAFSPQWGFAGLRALSPGRYREGTM